MEVFAKETWFDCRQFFGEVNNSHVNIYTLLLLNSSYSYEGGVIYC